MTVQIRPARVPGPAAGRELDGQLCVTRAGSVVHWRRPTPHVWPACEPYSADGPSFPAWFPDGAGDVAARWLCAQCALTAGLDPARVSTAAAELATVHAHDVARAELLLTPEARARARLDARSAAIDDGSLVEHVRALAAGRPPVWPADVADIPTAAEAYGPPLRMPWELRRHRLGRRHRPDPADYNPRSWSTR